MDDCKTSRALQLLAPASGAGAAEVAKALAEVVAGGADAAAAFSRGFGPRRLLRFMSSADDDDGQLETLADEILKLCTGGKVAGLAPNADFDETTMPDMYPDEVIELEACPAEEECVTPPAASPMSLRLLSPHPASSWNFHPASGRVVLHDATAAPGATANVDASAASPSLRLRSSSRRSRLGSEIECKVWPAAVILARWLWLHPWIVRGRRVLELGAGVGTAGLAAARAGARRVVLTDINGTALRLARDNATINGAQVAAAAHVAHLDWGEPPVRATPLAWELEPAGAGGAAAAADTELCGRFPVILAADVINADGLSELVRRFGAAYGTLLGACARVSACASTPCPCSSEIRPSTGVQHARALPRARRPIRDGLPKALPPARDRGHPPAASRQLRFRDVRLPRPELAARRSARGRGGGARDLARAVVPRGEARHAPATPAGGKDPARSQRPR